jgi:hypothetical protein
MHKHGVKSTHGWRWWASLLECNELRHEERCFALRIGKLEGLRFIITQCVSRSTFRATVYTNMHIEHQEIKNLPVEKMQK